MLETKQYWHDTEQTILVMEVQGREWEWNDTFAAMQKFGEMGESVNHSIYTVIVFHDSPPTPKGGVFHNVRRMMDLRPQNEVICVFVGTNIFFSTILNTVGKIHGLRLLLGKLRFVGSFSLALEEIEKHRAETVAKS